MGIDHFEIKMETEISADNLMEIDQNEHQGASPATDSSSRNPRRRHQQKLLKKDKGTVMSLSRN